MGTETIAPRRLPVYRFRTGKAVPTDEAQRLRAASAYIVSVGSYSSVPTAPAQIIYTHDLPILNTTSYWDGTYYFIVEGQILNNTNVIWTHPQAIVRLYDESGRLINVDLSDTKPSFLPPGQITGFRSWFDARVTPPNPSYKITMEAYRGAGQG